MGSRENPELACSTDATDAEKQASRRSKPRQWSSLELFGDEREILITHGAEVYRLRQTRNGKLILHK